MVRSSLASRLPLFFTSGPTPSLIHSMRIRASAVLRICHLHCIDFCPMLPVSQAPASNTPWAGLLCLEMWQSCFEQCLLFLSQPPFCADLFCIFPPLFQLSHRAASGGPAPLIALSSLGAWCRSRRARARTGTKSPWTAVAFHIPVERLHGCIEMNANVTPFWCLSL